MTQANWVELIVAFFLVVIAGLIAAGEAALHSLSRSRADELVEAGKPGAKRVRQIMADPPRYLNSALLLRTIFEICAIVLIALVIFAELEHTWSRLLLTAGIMIVVSYIWWGVAPRTFGRQRADRIAGMVAAPLVTITTVLGPLPKLLIAIGNALTPGGGFREGPFSTEAELRELVDLAEASQLIESDESKMIHSVFELGDTIVKEVMVPRTDMVYIGRDETLRQAMSLCLRSGFSRIPVIGDGLDDVVGVLYLKDIMKRVFDQPAAENTECAASAMREPQWCPDSKPVDALLREMQLKHSHVVIVVDEFGGTAGLATIEDILEEIVGDITDEYDQENNDVTELGDGRYRVSSRLSVEDLGELFGLNLDDEDVETVGGLMAKELNRVPIAGAVVKYGGLELVAERTTGRRNKIGTFVAGRVADEPGDGDAEAITAGDHRMVEETRTG